MQCTLRPCERQRADFCDAFVSMAGKAILLYSSGIYKGGIMISRRRKFYGWGYADEGATPDEIQLLEKTLATRFGIQSFDVTPAPRAEEISLRAPRLDVPAALKDIVSTAHLDRLEHCYR